MPKGNQMIHNVAAYRFNNNYPQKVQNLRSNVGLASNFSTQFRGMSCPSQYRTSFDYMASELISRNTKRWGVDGSLLSASKIKEAIDRLFKLNKVFGPYIEANIARINWRNYIPQDIREYCVNKINDARADRLKHWQNFLENPDAVEGAKDHPELVMDVKTDKSLKFIIWDAINSEIKINNRHIPVPLDLTALEETVQYFKDLMPKFRAVSCATTSFLDMYTHRLRDNLLMKKGLSDKNEVWVRIPSAKRDPENLDKNIADLEILSYKNWCTRSSVDKAADALADGDFYLYLKRDEQRIWHSILGMASSRGKIDQIQGRENNNFIPTAEVENIKAFLSENKLQCQSGIVDEGPKALQQILIAEHLAKGSEIAGKSLSKAIKDKDDAAMLKILGHSIKYTPEGNYEIGTYKPTYLLNKKSGLVAPYSFMGIDENILLRNVEKINGDLYLYHRNKLFNSSMTEFPPSLKTVTGRVICTKEQYEKFGEDIRRIVANESMIKVCG